MKVLHVIPSLSSTDGGPSRALALMEQALSAQGITVHTATTDDAGPHQRNGKPCGQPLAENGVHRWYFPKRMDFYKASPAFASWIAREVRSYDLLHIHALFSFTSTVAAWAARRSGVPYVLRPLGTLNAYGVSQRRPWLKQLSMRLLEGPALRHAAAVHFTSESEARDAQALGLSLRSVVIPLGVECTLAPSRTPGVHYAQVTRAPRLLFLSRLDPKKNLESLIDACALIKDALPQLRLMIAGGGPPSYVSSLKARASALGLDQQITWAGHLEGEAKAQALAATDIFVLPSYSENFGIAAAEALAAGLPCVLGEGVAVAQDVAQAGAGLAVAPAAAAIAQALRNMAQDPHALAGMAERASALAKEKYSVTAMGENLTRLYSEILLR